MQSYQEQLDKGVFFKVIGPYSDKLQQGVSINIFTKKNKRLKLIDWQGFKNESNMKKDERHNLQFIEKVLDDGIISEAVDIKFSERYLTSKFELRKFDKDYVYVTIYQLIDQKLRFYYCLLNISKNEFMKALLKILSKKASNDQKHLKIIEIMLECIKLATIEPYLFESNSASTLGQNKFNINQINEMTYILHRIQIHLYDTETICSAILSNNLFLNRSEIQFIRVDGFCISKKLLNQAQKEEIYVTMNIFEKVQSYYCSQAVILVIEYCDSSTISYFEQNEIDINEVSVDRKYIDILLILQGIILNNIQQGKLLFNKIKNKLTISQYHLLKNLSNKSTKKIVDSFIDNGVLDKEKPQSIQVKIYLIRQLLNQSLFHKPLVLMKLLNQTDSDLLKLIQNHFYHFELAQSLDSKTVKMIQTKSLIQKNSQQSVEQFEAAETSLKTVGLEKDVENYSYYLLDRDLSFYFWLVEIKKIQTIAQILKEYLKPIKMNLYLKICQFQILITDIINMNALSIFELNQINKIEEQGNQGISNVLKNYNRQIELSLAIRRGESDDQQYQYNKTSKFNNVEDLDQLKQKMQVQELFLFKY
ncbi:hypothetical protein ABPG72_008150 [Tetrahymena utriculariae]